MFRFDRRILANFDWVLLGLMAVLCTMAMFNLYSASYPPKPWGMPPYLKQGYLLGGCFICFLVIISFDYQQLHTFNYFLYGGVIFLLLLVSFKGSAAGGAQRWIDLGFFRLQPSEPAKLVMVITLASYYSQKEVIAGYTTKEVMIPAALTGVPFLLIALQPDLGTALMLGIIFVSMSMLVRLRFSAWLSLGTLVMLAAFAGRKKIFNDYQKQRIMTFLNPEKDHAGNGYQVLQSKIAVGSGEMFGKGYLEGKQGHLHFLPERHTDFAFSVWGEEWGFIGAAFFLAMYFLMLLWGLYIASRAKDRFGVLLAYGVVILIFWQAVINLLMILGALPVVGIPLPLVSYGGSSLLTTIAGLAILMSVRLYSFNPSAPSGYSQGKTS
ncbi:MAG: rod shape-determining protein RodA [Deltaproteobacteria bacterium]|nr:MAG: rod shape-determining protein RodA [Deltaproteobacteria bacterium]